MRAAPNARHSSAPHRTPAWLASITVALLLLSTSATALQDEAFSASAGKFACSDGAAFPSVDDQYAGVSLVPLDGAPKDSAAVQPRSFGPYTQDGRMSVAFYQFLAGSEEASIATQTELHVYVHVLRAKGDSWYELKPKDPQTVKADPASKDENGDPDKPETKAKTSDAPDIYTPDPSIPLFELSYASRWLGANSTGNYGHMLLLDFRSNTPRVLRHLECTSGEGGGVVSGTKSTATSKHRIILAPSGLHGIAPKDSSLAKTQCAKQPRHGQSPSPTAANSQPSRCRQPQISEGLIDREAPGYLSLSSLVGWICSPHWAPCTPGRQAAYRRQSWRRSIQ
jgi:hypothetical protein